jgi:hypothetical protein
MSASTSAITAPTSVNTSGTFTTPVFWENLWRKSGINFVALSVIAYVIYPSQPQAGASSDVVGAFYNAERTRILIAAALAAWNVVNIMWFAAALRNVLADKGEDGWGAAHTASSAAFGALFLLLMTVGAALAYSIAGAGNSGLTSALNDFLWAGVVMTSFPRAMLIMSGSFGLWRARLISNRLFGAGVAAVVLALLGGFTWMSDGFLAPDGAYSRFISPLIGLVWVVVVSRVVTRAPATRVGW